MEKIWRASKDKKVFCPHCHTEMAMVADEDTFEIFFECGKCEKTLDSEEAEQQLTESKK